MLVGLSGIALLAEVVTLGSLLFDLKDGIGYQRAVNNEKDWIPVRCSVEDSSDLTILGTYRAKLKYEVEGKEYTKWVKVKYTPYDYVDVSPDILVNKKHPNHKIHKLRITDVKHNILVEILCILLVSLTAVLNYELMMWLIAKTSIYLDLCKKLVPYAAWISSIYGTYNLIIVLIAGKVHGYEKMPFSLIISKYAVTFIFLLSLIY